MERPMTIREEANALTCCAYRNGTIEELHAGKHSALLEIRLSTLRWSAFLVKMLF